MSSWETEKGEIDLIAALNDQSFWVRIGAARSLGQTNSSSGTEALYERWAAAEKYPEERWIIATALEQSGVDSLPLISSFLKMSLVDLQKQLESYPTWHEFVISKQHDYSRSVLEIMLEFEPTRRYRYSKEAEGESFSVQVLDSFERAASTLQHELFLASIWVKNDEFQARSNQLSARLLDALRSGDGSQQQSAVNELVNLALCEPNGWFRGAGAEALASLGASAGAILIPSLAGSPPIFPTKEQLHSLATQRSNTMAPIDAPLDVAIYFAAEALAKFRDTETVSALAQLAAEGANQAGLRAELILADMSLEVSLPQLFWEAVNALEYDVRERAVLIIKKILNKERHYAIHFHRINGKLVEAQFQWLNELLTRCLDLAPWAVGLQDAGTLAWSRNKDSSVKIIANALQMVPFVQGEVTIHYSDKSPWDKFVGYFQRFKSHERQALENPTRSLEAKRYLNCDCPRACQVGEEIALRVQLDPLPSPDGLSSTEVDLSFAPGEKFVDLLVMVRAFGLDLRPDYGAIRVLPVGPSSRAEFRIVPKDLGCQRIEVMIFKGTERIGYTCLFVEVTAQESEGRRVPPLVLDEPTNRDLLRRGETRAVIQVEWRHDGVLSFSVIDPSLGRVEPKSIGDSPSSFSHEIARDWVVRQSTIVQEYLKEDYETENELRGALASISAIGLSLFRQIAPASLVEAARDWPTGSIISVESNEGWIPWELLADSVGGQLWGERFQLIRIPRIPRDLEPSAQTIAQVTIREPQTSLQKIVSVVGDGIPMGSERGAYSSDRTFGVTKEMLSELIMSDFEHLQREIRDADIVHFTCHGRGGSTYHLSLGNGAGRRLVIGQVESLNLKPGAIIFANACSSDKSELLLSEFQSFGWNFYTRGARPFIGTLGPVPVKHAIAFAEHFYKRLMFDGLTAGQALRQARLDTAVEFKNPFSLFYCVYGPASTRRKLRR